MADYWNNHGAIKIRHRKFDTRMLKLSLNQCQMPCFELKYAIIMTAGRSVKVKP